MKTDRWALAGLVVLFCAGLSSPAAALHRFPATTFQQNAPIVVASWPAKTRAAARALLEKYGLPDTLSETHLTWVEAGPWKEVTVFRDADVPKNPTVHADFIENTVKYEVPIAQVAPLMRFNRALVIDMSQGTLAAHSDSEASNTLALNLADEIIKGKRGVAASRTFLKKTQAEALSGKSSPYTERLLFAR
jgi:hypothetical protein